jgi:hypothetical protein
MLLFEDTRSSVVGAASGGGRASGVPGVLNRTVGERGPGWG